MSDFAVQKPTRTISLGFGSSSEAVVKQDRLTDLNIAFRYSKKPSQNKRFVCKHRAVSLSLYFYDLLSKFANSLGLEDRPTYLIRGKHAYQDLLSSPTLRPLKGTFQTSTFFQMHAMGGSRRGTGGPDPPEKSQKYRVS